MHLCRFIQSFQGGPFILQAKHFLPQPLQLILGCSRFYLHINYAACVTGPSNDIDPESNTVCLFHCLFRVQMQFPVSLHASQRCKAMGSQAEAACCIT